MLKKADIAAAAAILLAAWLIFAFTLPKSKPGNTVLVTVDKQEYGRYPLSEDRTVEIKGIGTNLLVIENGSAYVKSADCPDKICVNHKPISESGEAIVCLPNKVVVEIN
ncbi:MAG TPA: NusG domain II-containing protein [Clostridiales bacterium]|nr:NusG domain II-containing protein [Clostridiales bacterium]